MALVTDPVNGFLPYEDNPVTSADSGPLAGLTLAVKDISSVMGFPNGWGSPCIRAQAVLDNHNAPAIQQLLDAGCHFVGKSHCDEFCYSLNGINAHYGAPINTAAPDRVTGGSSCGSAALVAAGVVDIATGSDTAGSIRVPASYCGLVGLRTSHGRIPLADTMPLAPSFDVFGWFARDIDTYDKVGAVMLGEDQNNTELDCAISVNALEQMLMGQEERNVYSTRFKQVAKHFGKLQEHTNFDTPLPDLATIFRTLQGYEAWASLGGWIKKVKPELGPGIKERLEFGSSVSREQYDQCTQIRATLRHDLKNRLADNSVIILPTSPGVAPFRDASQDQLQALRERALCLLCISGLSGFPQITIPLGQVQGAPVGISLIGPKNSDRRLIALARQILQD